MFDNSQLLIYTPGMNKTLLMIGAGGLILLIILGGAGFFFLNKNKSKSTSEVQVTQMVTPQTETVMESGQSFKDLMKLSTNQQCTFTDTSTQNSGTVYGGSGKVRGDFSSVVNGTSLASHVISDGKTVYVWTDGQPQGFKMTLTEMETLPQDTTSKSVDLDKKVDYSCNAWITDNSKFQVPTTVKFSDMSKMMKDVMGQTNSKQSTPSVPAAATKSLEDIKASQCAACDSLPAASQAQCRQTLGC